MNSISLRSDPFMNLEFCANSIIGASIIIDICRALANYSEEYAGRVRDGSEDMIYSPD